jgi:hypothetical protein
MLFREIIAVYCENHMEQTNARCKQDVGLILMLKQVVHIVTTAIRGLCGFCVNTCRVLEHSFERRLSKQHCIPVRCVSVYICGEEERP